MCPVVCLKHECSAAAAVTALPRDKATCVRTQVQPPADEVAAAGGKRELNRETVNQHFAIDFTGSAMENTCYFQIHLSDKTSKKSKWNYSQSSVIRRSCHACSMSSTDLCSQLCYARGVPWCPDSPGASEMLRVSPCHLQVHLLGPSPRTLQPRRGGSPSLLVPLPHACSAPAVPCGTDVPLAAGKQRPIAGALWTYFDKSFLTFEC